MANSNLKIVGAGLSSLPGLNARILGILPILLVFAFVTGAKAQTQPAAEMSAPVSSAPAANSLPAAVTLQQTLAPKAGVPAQPNQTPTPSVIATQPPSAGGELTSGSTIGSTLKDLSVYYELEAQRLAAENSKLRTLFSEGLIARIELEKSDKSLADAQAKVQETRKQIAEAEAAGKPLVATSMIDTTQQQWTTGNPKIDNLIQNSGTRFGVDPYLIYCVISQESGFRSGAISGKGARGLMQLMPGTAARYGVRNPYDPAQSIMGGTRYLKDLLELFKGRVDLALAGYNAGENAVIKHGYVVPPYSETRNYVRLISMRYSSKKGVPLVSKI